MNLLKAIIVDDETAAREATQLSVESFCPDVSVLHTFNNVDDAAEYTRNHSVDLVFLDIEMPNKNGFEFFNLADCSQLQVIFTTGHDHYAVQAFKYSACHYLLKPIVPRDLIAACSLAKDRKKSADSQQLNYLQELIEDKPAFPSRLVITVGKSQEIIELKDIIRLEAERNYTWVYRKDQTRVLATKNMKEFEDLMDPHYFYRIHQSHMVNGHSVQKINNINGAEAILNDGTALPISRHKKRQFIQWLEKL